MIAITKLILRRPVSTFLAVLSLLFFGFIAFTTMKMELLPDMNFPYMIVSTVYPGASPEDIDELVSKPIEEEVSLLSDVEEVQSRSMENVSMVIVRYRYGTNMDRAYDKLKKKLDVLKGNLPDDAEDPDYIEFDINAQAGMVLAISDKTKANLYNYVKNNIEPEMEKLSSVASVSLSGGQAEYVRVELSEEKLAQYHLTMENIIQMIKASDFTYPAGSTYYGKQKLSLSVSEDYSTIEKLKNLPLLTGTGNTLYLRDLATVSESLEEKSSIGRYNGEDTIGLSLSKTQIESDIAMSRDVKETIKDLEAQNPNLSVHIIQDNADSIKSSLSSVFQTMIMAVVISMAIIFFFFGDVKASLIVGSSIPIAILGAIVFMYAMGYSMNMLTLSALVLGVGMMVDNSIVVLEASFRAMDEAQDERRSRRDAAIDAVRVVGASVFGSTLTTCVVFLPLGFLKGIAGQYFKPLGFTIVFCMLASLLSAITIVPLCFTLYKPKENEKAPAYKAVRSLQNSYRTLIGRFLRHKKAVVLGTFLILFFSLFLATKIRSELMPDIDSATVQISVLQKPGLDLEERDKAMREIEAMVAKDPDVDRYTTLSGGGTGFQALYGGDSSSTVTAYLKKKRSVSTKEKAKTWQKLLETRPDEVITVKSVSDANFGASDEDVKTNEGYEVILKGADLQSLKEKSDALVSEMQKMESLTGIHSSLENAAPRLLVKVDPIKASAEGLSPIALGQSLNSILGGKTVMKIDLDGEKADVRVEYPKDRFDTLEKIKNIRFSTPRGAAVALDSVATVDFSDSPATIIREDKKYVVTIRANYTEKANKETKEEVDRLVESHLGRDIALSESLRTKNMREEFTDLFRAIAIAVFLVFVVMAGQFESLRFSFMVMTTVPFAMIGSFGLLWLFDATISMTSLLGFLMLVGTVVNNGILYVDTVNQYREDMPLDRAIIESGATRLRPILMTTLTTVLSMVPMAMAIGENGKLMQGLALVDVGGLTASTLLALLLLPVYYRIMYGKKNSIA
ncbi:efflux RND transporter permease subunit [Oribacterium asaccharolyticum]|uniref:efflux RND transporter permease subunit n=1 Tax=Oribacterium asaccharolyticum TaxID=1501332 RepID=UPI0028E884F7|nr:efflux RND transporter permease subunit [Oribacterium asaccharolyticum]